MIEHNELYSDRDESESLIEFSMSEIITALKYKKLLYKNEKYYLQYDPFHGRHKILEQLNIDHGFFLINAKSHAHVAITDPFHCAVKTALNNLVDIYMKNNAFGLNRVSCMSLLWFDAKRGFLDELVKCPS